MKKLNWRIKLIIKQEKFNSKIFTEKQCKNSNNF